MEKVIINADDFGRTPSVNKAIVECFERGLINSTTLMSNTPYFEEAVELSFKHKISEQIGVHLNIDNGNLLTTEILSTGLFDSKNNLKLNKKRLNLFLLSKLERKLIYNEFVAQIERVKNAGILITHLDTHHHVHEIYPIAKILLDLLKIYKIPSMRILHNMNDSSKYYKRAYRNFLNRMIENNNANHSDLFGDQLEVIALLSKQPEIIREKKIEIMVHPDYNDEELIVDRIKDREYSMKYDEEFTRLTQMNWSDCI